MIVRESVSKVLQEVVNRLVEGLEPDRIYLFGSASRGDASRSSDFDLMVVVPHSDLPRHKREAFSYNLLWGLSIPVDVLVFTQEEFNQASQVKTSLASTVQKEGQVLYQHG